MISKSKILFLIFIFINNLFAIDVLVAKKKIAYKEIIKISSLQKITLKKLNKNCAPLKISDLNNSTKVYKGPKGSYYYIRNYRKFKIAYTSLSIISVTT